jgi:hypothetical protein
LTKLNQQSRTSLSDPIKKALQTTAALSPLQFGAKLDTFEPLRGCLSIPSAERRPASLPQQSSLYIQEASLRRAGDGGEERAMHTTPAHHAAAALARRGEQVSAPPPAVVVPFHETPPAPSRPRGAPPSARLHMCGAGARLRSGLTKHSEAVWKQLRVPNRSWQGEVGLFS